VLEVYAGAGGGIENGTPDAASLLKPSELGARMRLQVGFTLATIFLALFTAALWKERSQKERVR
jgi:hypothetical protein